MGFERKTASEGGGIGGYAKKRSEGAGIEGNVKVQENVFCCFMHRICSQCFVTVAYKKFEHLWQKLGVANVTQEIALGQLANGES